MNGSNAESVISRAIIKIMLLYRYTFIWREPNKNTEPESITYFIADAQTDLNKHMVHMQDISDILYSPWPWPWSLRPQQ